MSEINDGGPAFPWGEHGQILGGMTLRDYFATGADIPWEVAADIVYRQSGNRNGTTAQIIAMRSELRYEQADSMLKARGQS